ncbi:MAG: mandelate racemase/muconate lactonizing enzyme family protein [Marivibrio sp.]|uniref:mandelate racemase/muconate lactonizing enzyme family protein n=1 Tax=Marivibrio sp. TaxID=2039719 RepID=UPI0032EB2598
MAVLASPIPASTRAPAHRIAEIRVWTTTLTSHVAYEMAAGKRCAAVETVVLSLTTDSGLVGWGEVCPIPHYLPAYARGVAPGVAEVAPALLGADATGPEAAIAACMRVLPGHPFVHSPIDIALWDLLGKIAGQPLSALLGGRRAAALPVYHSITCIDPHEMARIAQEAQAQGVTQFQVKLGADDDWAADAARLTLVREALGPGPLVYGDWNCGATSLDASRVARAVAHLDVMLEQPCRTLEECARVRAAAGLPMKLDEGVHDTASLIAAHRAGCLDAAAIKLSKFGGLSAARQARDLCQQLGVKMCVEDTWGSDVATAAALALGASCDQRFLLNVCDLSGYVSPRLAPDGPTRRDGRIAPPEGPGLGVEPDPALLGAPDLVLA